MDTPSTAPGRAQYDSLPALDAILAAWNRPGRNAAWHRAAQQTVRRAMPTLAHALDRATSERTQAR